MAIERPEFAPWLLNSPNRPSNSKDGDKNQFELLPLIGEATTTWEFNESLLALLFMQISASSSRGIIRAFGSIVGTGARIDMLLASGESYFHGSDEKLKEFKFLMNAARRCVSLRNIIAHSMIVQKYKDEINSVDFRVKITPPDTTYFLCPAMYNTQKTEMNWLPRIFWSSNEVREVISQFRILTFLLAHFPEERDGPVHVDNAMRLSLKPII